MAEPSVDDLAFDANGLVPAIAQDAVTGRVLMLAWMNRGAYLETVAEREATFWSRSRQEIWRKGATSGNRLAVESIAVDCDSDAVLLSVTPAGPACHTGAISCFEDAAGAERFDELATLWSTITDRVSYPSPGSYTSQLVGGGPQATGRKVLEEAGEVVESAIRHGRTKDDDHRLTEEVADLLYHTLVLMAERGIAPNAVMDELRSRRTPRAS